MTSSWHQKVFSDLDAQLDGAPRVAQWMHSVQEQMGVDPISKLADAINNLADALRAANASES